jgi:hypothetical protein
VSDQNLKRCPFVEKDNAVNKTRIKNFRMAKLKILEHANLFKRIQTHIFLMGLKTKSTKG